MTRFQNLPSSTQSAQGALYPERVLESRSEIGDSLIRACGQAVIDRCDSLHDDYTEGHVAAPSFSFES